MAHNFIHASGVRTHNLKNITIDIPKHQIVAFTGVSGSGKSSLVFDTVYTEAQRQLVETFSTFARARLPKLSRPEVDELQNLSTAILIDQKPMGSNLRSTLGTATEIVTYLRLLFSRCAEPAIGPSFYYSFNHPEGMCPTCHGLGTAIGINRDRLVRWDMSLRQGALDHPECRPEGFLWRELVSMDLFDPDKPVLDFSAEELFLLLDTEPVPITKQHGTGTYMKNWEGFARRLVRLKTAKGDPESGTPAGTSGKSSVYDEYFIYGLCSECEGSRLNARARGSHISGNHIGQLCSMELTDLAEFLESLSSSTFSPGAFSPGTLSPGALSPGAQKQNPDPGSQPADRILAKAKIILQGLIAVGLGYLTLERPVSTLSGGESQRVKTARQLDCDLTDLLYILDEPSAGLHPRDTEQVMNLLTQLRDRGNSVLVVEHDPAIIRRSDWVIDLGPGGGASGGQVVFCGPPDQLLTSGTKTGMWLEEEPLAPAGRDFENFYRIHDARTHNLQGINVKLPVAGLTCVTGVSGSGKSTLIHDEFLKAHPQAVIISQSAIGRTSRGNLVTYAGIFDSIRKIFSAATGQDAGLFSFNSVGACSKCGGQGVLSTELFFLDAVQTPCDECGGKRYHPDVLTYTYRGRSIDDVLEMTAGEALDFFDHKKIQIQLQLLLRVGLDYLKLGQSLSTLSGGEAQRLKLAAQLSKQGNIYILDEPTRGLHRADIQILNQLIQDLVQAGNTVIVIEHNMDIVKYAHWIVDLGPGAGKNGGRLLYQGPASGILECPESQTSTYIRQMWRC